MEKRNKRLLSLFSGCGGMDLGFEGNFEVLKECINKKLTPHWIESEQNGRVNLHRTNFELVFANDILSYAKSAWIPYFSRRGLDPEVFSNESIVDLVKKHKAGESVFPGSVDVVIGGFPCQDFSLAGDRKGFNSRKGHHGKTYEESSDQNLDDENRGRLYYWMKEVIEITQPKVFVAENVKGLVSLSNVKEIIESDFRDIDQGYVVLPARVLNVKHFGVPQNRERVIFIGLSKRFLKKEIIEKIQSGHFPEEINPYPPQTHGLSGATVLEAPLQPIVTLGSVFKDLSEPDDETIDLSQMSYSKAKYYGKVQGNVEIKLDNVSPTIRAEHHGNIEFRRLSKENGGVLTKELDSGLQERRLTVRECARIQTFPDSYEFVRSRSTSPYSLSASGGYKVIGNAVPPLFAYHIARRLEDIWPRIFDL